MKKILLYLIFVVTTSYTYAVDSTVIAGVQDRILEELIEIRALQDSTYNQRIRAFEARDKSLNGKIEPSPSEYSILSGIENNTSFKFWNDSWSFYGVIALVFSLLALYYTRVQYISQKETELNTSKAEKHTKNAPISVQKAKLEALPRHFYRNIVCTCAIIFNHLHPENGKSGHRKSYPSESNLLKLQTLPDDILLPIDIDENSYQKMHELKLLFRNYNMEIQVASNHLSQQHLTDDSLVQDFDNLLYKPFHLENEMFEYEEKLCSIDINKLREKSAYTIANEHFKKLNKTCNFAVLMRPLNNAYLKQLLESNFSYIRNLDKKGALLRSLEGISASEININKENCSQELINFIKEISAEKFKFIEWFNKYYKNNIVDPLATLTVDDLYDSFKPYLDYISGNEWNFETLFYYMLAVDIAIETDRIGMINY